MWHDADRRKEGAEINQSLHALKECMRHWVLVQDGRNGFDGSTEPFGEAAETVGPVGTPMPALPPRPSGLSSNRVLRVAIGVAVLLLVLALL